MKELKHQVIDLEQLANHKGSTFGKMGPPPTQEQFENNLALQWMELDTNSPVWLENESRRIGDASIPGTQWKFRTY